MGLKRKLMVMLAAFAVVALGTSSTASAERADQKPVVKDLATFAAAGCTGGCGSGSTVGPDGALYVTDGKAGKLLRVDPNTGAITTWASLLPPSIPAVGIGGAIDVAFIGNTAYVLVTLVGPFFGQSDVVDGIYRVEEGGTPEPIADIGAWAIANPPKTDFFITTGVQYAIERYRGGFLVTDGHHNRVLYVALHDDDEAEISLFRAFGDIVPTGLEVSKKTVYMAEAGPVPHEPATGKVVSLRSRSHPATVASGAPLLVDVELGPDHELYALSQGIWDLGPDPANAGMPASSGTGALVRVDDHGFERVVEEALDRPTSLEFIGDTAFVITLTGHVIRIDNVPGDDDGGAEHHGDGDD